MRIPLIATYRLQLGRAFNFAQAAARVPYLRKLGISHLYLSPVLDAATGSLHGYDVVNHTQLAPGLGGAEGFAQLVSAAHTVGIGIVLDLVPNHMSIADERNRWWWDVLENGPSSRWAHAFDVDWDPPEPRLKNVVLMPVLGDHLSQVLQSKQLKLERDGARFVVRYFEHRFPVAPPSLGVMLRHAATRCDEPRLGFLADAFAELPPPTRVDPASVERRHRDKEVLREMLEALLQRSRQVARAIDEELQRVNDTPPMLDALLELQSYRLAFWRSAERDLDYRRFFDINSLVALRMEDPKVFAEAHALIEKLYLRGDLDGLRVDHVDGLADPAGYLAQLRALAPGATIHVEKILGKDERLPPWPIDGTTGYEHGAELVALFTIPAAEAALKALTVELTGDCPDFEPLAIATRQQVLRELLASDVNRLVHTLVRLSDRYWELRDYTRHELRELVAALAASFPVYRTYVVPADKAVSPTDQAVIAQALATARALAPNVDAALFDFVAGVLRLERTGALEAEFVSRLQQLTAPTMAKGVEDTAFYRYTTLLALAEVGGSPERFHLPLAAFHARNLEEQQNWPRALNATSTHDSKRSADVRARLVAMSQAPEKFAQLARAFFNRSEQFLVGQLPDPKMRMIALQTLVGAWPLHPDRFKATLEKSAREAKLHTSWLRPDPGYDAALGQFATAVLADSVITRQLDEFVLELLPKARAISLGWVLL
ncbi:MAG: treY, partial [Myxococcaceae bacterium]|nr:treY [Myxococcaceae bacterium]